MKQRFASLIRWTVFLKLSLLSVLLDAYALRWLFIGSVDHSFVGDACLLGLLSLTIANVTLFFLCLIDTPRFMAWRTSLAIWLRAADQRVGRTLFND